LNDLDREFRSGWERTIQPKEPPKVMVWSVGIILGVPFLILWVALVIRLVGWAL